MLKNNSQNIPLDGKAFTHMKNLRILKIYFPQFKELWQPFAVKLTGSLDFLSNELRLFCWHGYPFKYLPLDFYPENIVAIDLSYSNINNFWTTPKVFPCSRMFSYLISNDLITYLLFCPIHVSALEG